MAWFIVRCLWNSESFRWPIDVLLGTEPGTLLLSPPTPINGPRPGQIWDTNFALNWGRGAEESRSKESSSLTWCAVKMRCVSLLHCTPVPYTMQYAGCSTSRSLHQCHVTTRPLSTHCMCTAQTGSLDVFKKYSYSIIMFQVAGERLPPDDDFNDIRCDRYAIMPLCHYAIRDHLKLSL